MASVPRSRAPMSGGSSGVSLPRSGARGPAGRHLGHPFQDPAPPRSEPAPVSMSSSRSLRFARFQNSRENGVPVDSSSDSISSFIPKSSPGSGDACGSIVRSDGPSRPIPADCVSNRIPHFGQRILCGPLSMLDGSLPGETALRTLDHHRMFPPRRGMPDIGEVPMIDHA